MDHTRILHHASPRTELVARDPAALGSAATAIALAGAAPLARGTHTTRGNRGCARAFYGHCSQQPLPTTVHRAAIDPSSDRGNQRCGLGSTGAGFPNRLH